MSSTITSDQNHNARPALAGQVPSDIEKLMTQFPHLWETIRKEVPQLFRTSTPAEIAHHAQALKQSEIELRTSAANKQISRQAALTRYAEIRLRLYAMQKFLHEVMARASGPKLSKRDQQIAQRLFFTKDHRRRAVSAAWFPLFWKMISNKAGVVQELKSRGIYCVFSQQFGAAIAKLVGSRSCVEIGAGDGTLTVLLEEQGLRIPATDDCSWQHVVNYPDWIEKLSAKATLEKYQPKVVLCSWPPPGNDFERAIFAHPSVQTYVVIGSKHDYASGDRNAYQSQKSFQLRHADELSRLVLPPEFDHEVLVFDRQSELEQC
jgi:hypothetical protein